ncbi:MAG: MBL fold metallo-hydrolase, partial [Chloroflexi bacterium]|nr:MBL fold metallo-hydrolase [Chloroflexota bacterium]
ALGYDPDAIQYLVPTHIHVDHGGGCGWVAQQLPRLKVAVHSRGARHLLDPSRLIQSTAMVFGERWEEGFGPILPVPADRLLVREEGAALSLGGRRHRFYYAPGHAPHHWAIMDEERRILYCGEAMGQPAGDSKMVGPPTSPPLFELDDALQTIEKLSQLDVAQLYYSHYGHGTQPPQEAMVAVLLSTREFAQIIREGFEDSQDVRAIDRRLQDWCARQGYPVRRPFDGTIQPYLAYFRRQAQAKAT